MPLIIEAQRPTCEQAGFWIKPFLGLSPGQGHCTAILGKTLTLTVPLSTQVYKWVPADLMLGVTLQWTSIPRGQ